MARDVPESDWKRFRELRELALERFCKRVFAELEPLVQNVSRTYYERYLDVFHLLKERDRELARAFDDPRRSHMIEQLAAMRASGLVEPGELALFTTSTRTAVEEVAKAAARQDRRLTSA